ncbi:MAG: ABC transporter ATP-binding protein [Rhizobiales bacterium 65-79]|jgi:branched-chain amino acid transport system ATP-binding protein|nr:ABC transporter ATP-binding protein [Hyphomicrobiales bacterium]OJU05753.1 MAG: ABC transporter ATP-binding protein [Rhizobiales bacterium 65-79]
MLEVRQLVSGYGPVEAVHGIDLKVAEGKAVAVIGANGAGKTTFLRTISGLMPLWSGSVTFEGRDVTRLSAHELARVGISHVPEGRKVFKPLDVETNLELGSYSRRDRTGASTRQDLERIYELFPRLRERRRQVTGTLSGGEQQMVAVGRALMGRPRLLLLDEPSLGLAPQIFHEIFAVLRRIMAEGVGMLIVEQNVRLALENTESAYVFQTGKVALHGPSRDLLTNETVKKAYLGGSI